MPKSLYTLKHEQLLRDLKNTIDGLLSTQVANVWSIYGGLNRLHSLMDKIFKHGCKLKDDVNGSYFNFLEGLEWLQPNTSNCYFSIDCEYQTYMPSHLKENKAAIWLYKNLENLSLSTKLGWLLSDKNHLNACYYSHAFLCDEEYSEAVLICLKALERNQPTLMAEINPCLFLLQPNARDFHKLHRRCSSFPDNYLGKMESKSIRRIKKLDERHSICDVTDHNRKSDSGIVFKLKPWSSTPNLFLDKMDIVKRIVQSKTVPNTPIHKKKGCKVERKSTRNCTFFKNNKEVSDQPTPLPYQSIPNKMKPIVIDNKNIVEYTPSTSFSSETTLAEKLDIFEQKSSMSVVDLSFRARPGEKDYKKTPQRSFIEAGGKTILPMSTAYIPTPVEGQSLLSFLTSSQLTRPNAELDRENAHFNVSEAIISAIEQMRCKKDMRVSEDPTDESDPEIMELKQRIRIRRRQKMVEKQRRVWASSVLNDGLNETTSASPPSTSSNTYSESSTSDNIDDIEIDEASNLTETKGLSNSMASLYSEADLKRTRGMPDGASDILSAESVAITLMSTFKGKRLPKASELQWLVSEKDAPQALLPLPKSWPVNPDDHLTTSISLRGTDDWAPPRPQIIFTLHPSSSSRFFKRKELMIKQNYRCAGCGMRVAPQYSSKFRYCEYLGRYFCTGCHSNQLALIPARILHKWDFSRLPVSTFSYRLLEQMYTDPLFRIFDLNKNIRKFSKDIEFHRKYALGLYYIKDFILTCDNTESIRKIMKPFIKNSRDELEMYSLEDLVKIKSGQMKTELKNVVDLSINHITDCQICMGRGHICELCKFSEVIFPWQLSFVSRCDSCGCCYHKHCWKVGSPCRKCIRLSMRKESNTSN